MKRRNILHSYFNNCLRMLYLQLYNQTRMFFEKYHSKQTLHGKEKPLQNSRLTPIDIWLEEKFRIWKSAEPATTPSLYVRIGELAFEASKWFSLHPNTWKPVVAQTQLFPYRLLQNPSQKRVKVIKMLTASFFICKA